MPNLNKVMLMGNLTRDPELRETPKGTAVLEIGLAVNRTYTAGDGQQRQDTTFVDITFWGRQAEVIHQYCRKGRPLYVEGRLNLDTWEDRNTGQQRSKLRVVGESFQFLGGRDDNGGGGGGYSQQASAGYQSPPVQQHHQSAGPVPQQQAPPPQQQPQPSPAMASSLPSEDDEDIPF